MSSPVNPLGRDLGYQLASTLESIRRAEIEETSRRDDYKARMKVLHEEVDRLRQDLLTGQKQLPLDSVSDTLAGAELK